MARRTEYDASQAAKRLRVPAAAFRWARHSGVISAPDAPSGRWSRAAVEAMDPDTVRASLPREPISGGAAADRIAEALGTPNQPDEKANVGTFVVRRLIDRGLLKDLTTNPDGVLLNPDQVDVVCQREDLAALVAADTPLGPNQAAERLGVRRADFDHMLRLSWVKPAEWREVRFGTSRAGAVDVPMFRTVDIDALPATHPDIDWKQLRTVGKGQRSPLAAMA
ncbi:hypothetical protein J7E93_06770 [Streptomyces sp. ISL-36]|uniref:hypothetical protein n=1 Tax=Streptomyces sp. ISL-36 TaxID=2819182 RepID=UPI001BE79828|nr:hypothetical protein [Streptomyces sp. ISL-36]MBT2439829.1 hypothetical protein [Streptomyces sp. ISL-36]